jgi:putative ABC transport system ATP-binding protein
MSDRTSGVLAADRISLSYGATSALVDVSFAIAPGDRVALMGPSGCGKSSLMHCLAGVLRPDAGAVTLAGETFSERRDAERSRIRLRDLGVVFQFGDLVPELTLRENLMLPLQLLGAAKGEAAERADALLADVGVREVAHERAGTVSGGQAQRAAVARALVHEPRFVLADEPTGSLDTATAEQVLDLMLTLTERSGAGLLVVTHDNLVASHLDTLVTMRDGRVRDLVEAT